MLWIYDQATESESALFLDGAASLARQWLLRSGWWKIALAVVLAFCEITAGGLGFLLFGRRHLVEASHAVPHTGDLAQQPLTVMMVIYLALFVLTALTVMVIALTFWTRRLSRRLR
jgi:uncharacterized membrane protein